MLKRRGNTTVPGSSDCIPTQRVMKIDTNFAFNFVGKFNSNGHDLRQKQALANEQLDEDLPDGSCFSRVLRIETQSQSSELMAKSTVRKCEYIGSFPVTGTDHSTRADYVRSQLDQMKGGVQQKPILLVVSLSGVKVCSTDGKSVLMAHALRRISFATCDPENNQFSFLAREPNGHFSQQYCHSFLAPTAREAEELSRVVGAAFRMAYAQQLAQPLAVAASVVTQPTSEAHLHRGRRCSATSLLLGSPGSRRPTSRGDAESPSRSTVRECWAKKTAGQTKHQDPIANQAMEMGARSAMSGHGTEMGARSAMSGHGMEMGARSAMSGQRMEMDARSAMSGQRMEMDARSAMPGQAMEVGARSAISGQRMEMGARSAISGYGMEMGARSLSPEPSTSLGATAGPSRLYSINRIGDNIRPPGNLPVVDLWSPLCGSSSSEESNSPTDMNSCKQIKDKPPLHKKLEVVHENNCVEDIYPGDIVRPPSGGYINEEASWDGDVDLGVSSMSDGAKGKNNNYSPRKKSPSCYGDHQASAPPTDEDCSLEDSSGASSKRSSRSSCDRDHPSCSSSLSDMPGMSRRAHRSSRTGSTTSSNSSGTPPPPPERHDSLNVTVSEERELRNAAWFQAGIPREIALEILCQEPVGSFMVRESTSKPGCFALSLRVPREFHQSGIAHYLIMRTNRGYKIKGFTKEFATLTALITHHSVMPELLPCTLSLSRHNPAYRNHDSEDMVDMNEDPDYNLLSDFRRIMSDVNV